MDLIGFRCKHLRVIWILLGTSLLCSVAYSWRISQKCPHGHYYNDGCTACWCDIRTGITKCERLLQCARKNGNANCPRGRHYKDNCGNDCTCYESTGAVFCNEKRRCPPPTLPPVPVSSVNSNVFQRRDGLLAVNDEPMIMQSSTPRSLMHEYHSVSSSTPGSFMHEYHSVPSSTPRSFMNDYASVPSSTLGSFANGYPSVPSSTRSSIYDNVAVSSTPHPHLRVHGRSEELIIEPAIIIRKKGSNKASVVRNPYSATSVTLSGSSHNQNPSVFTPTRGTSTIYLNDNKPQNPRPPVAPLHLYEKQLKTIMDIRRAYAQLLRSKVNVNLRLPQSAPSNNNVDLNKFFIAQGNSNPSGSTEHPRRFDSEYGNSTVFTNTSPSPNFFSPSQQPAPPIQSTPLWRKPELIRNEIRNVLKNFSPVPPLKKLVNFVTTSTESYLSQFLNAGIRNKLNLQQPQQNTNFPIFGTTTNTPLSSTMSIYNNEVNVFPNGNSNSWPYSFPSSSPEPYHEINQFAPQHNTPIHQVYQNHDFSQIFATTTTTTPPPLPVQYTSYSNNYEQQQNHNLHYSSYYPKQFEKTKKPSNPYSPNHPQFPFMTELMQEIARVDSYDQSPSPTVSTPRSSPALTAVPTFSTPGPPYAEVDVVQPLSFLPPPRPEPATPTHRSFTVRPPPGKHRYPPRPTIRINMDKPIYVPNIMFPPQPMSPIRRNFVKPPFYQIHRQYIIPKPKQYRLVLKGGLREAAIRMDDVVPRFVSRIAQEFFKKPEIYVPKIRPGKPLTLEKVVLNHKEIIPKEVVFRQGESPTKMRFTPNAQWTMREEMAKHGIMLNEPLSPTRDYANNDRNVMEMDAPIHAVQTHETHTNMGMGHYPEAAPASFNVGLPTSINDQLNQIRQQQQDQQKFLTQNIQLNQQLPSFSNQNNQLNQQQPSFSNQNIQLNQHKQHQQQQQPSFSNQNIHLSQYHFNQQQNQQQQQPQFSILLPSPTPPQLQLQPPAISMDQRHQQDLQNQLNLLAQQHSINTAATASAGSTSNNAFQFDPNEFNDFKRGDEQDVLPKELQIPGVQQVIVDKVIVHDPLQPGGPIVFSTTTVQPPRNGNSQLLMGTNRRDGNSGTQTQPNLNVGPTPSSVLIRHHGAPSPSPASPTQPPSTGGNFLVTIINSTPTPHVTSTATTAVFQSPSQSESETSNAGVSNLASQIQEFLANQMDFGAKPEDSGLYGMMFQSRSGVPDGDPENDQPEPETRAEENEYRNDPDVFEDQIATETKMSTEVVDPDEEVDTDRLANIFSQDYQRKHGKKAPAVIVIRVPLNHSDGPFPKVIEKRGGEEVEIIGGALPSHSTKLNETLSDEDEDDEEISPSTENSIITSTSKSVSSSESKSESREENVDNKSSKSKRRKKKNKKRKRRKKDRRNRNKNVDDSNKEEIPKSEDEKEETKSEVVDKEKTISSITSEAESKFQAEIDWKSKLMSNICELNPSSPLCLTYRSICLLMTSDD